MDNTENDVEVDFSEFVNDIFYNEPKEKNSIHINYDDISQLFDKLVRIFKAGLPILYGTGDIDNIFFQFMERDFVKLDKYFNSMGYKLKYKICHQNKVLKLEQFVFNEQKNQIKDIDTKKYEKMYPCQLNVSDLIDPNTIRSDKLSSKTLKFNVGYLYFFFNFEVL